MAHPLLIVAMMVVFFALYGMAPRNPKVLRLYLIVTSFLAFSIILLHYLSLLAQPVSVKILPFLILEKWGTYEVVAVDWGQIIAVLFLVTLRGVYKNMRTNEVHGETKFADQAVDKEYTEDNGAPSSLRPETWKKDSRTNEE